MTTDNIVVPGDDESDEVSVDDLVADMGRIGAATRRRASALNDEAKALERKRENARIGARAVEQKLRDDSEVHAEEARQLAWILGKDAASPDQQDNEVPVISAPASERTTVVPVEDELPPEESWVEEVVPVTPPSPALEPEPTVLTPVVAEGPARVTLVERYHPRNWGWIAWLFALIGLAIGFGVWYIWPHWHTHDVDNLRLKHVLNVMWFFGLTLVGSCGGGLIGHSIEESNNE